MQAFSRWNALIHVLTGLMSGGKIKYHEAAMQSGLMGYKSRGHGKNKPFTMSYFSNTSRRKGTTNKFHSGNVTSAREIARRQKQDDKLWSNTVKHKGTDGVLREFRVHRTNRDGFVSREIPNV